MQWLYDLIHGIWVFTSAFFGKAIWLWKNWITFQIAVWTALFSVGVLVWRLFYYGITSLLGYISSLSTSLTSVSSVGSFGDILDIANHIFPVEEVFSMTAVLISYGVVCLTIRVVRAFIPMMT